MRALVTGSSGLLGLHLTRLLTALGSRVRAFHLPRDPMPADLDRLIEDWPGDVTDPKAVDRAVAGCDAVYHAAGFVSYWRGDDRRLQQVHVHGTRHLVEAALEAGVERFVYTSSVAAIGFDPTGAADESTEYNFGPFKSGYMEAKRAAEAEVQAGVRCGLSAVIVNPGGLVGPLAPQRSTLSIMRALQRGWLPGVPSGGLNVVAASDAAVGHLLAARSGKSGRRYILGGENLSHLELIRLTAETLGVRAPRRELPGWLFFALGAGCEGIAKLTCRPPVAITLSRARLGALNLFYRSERARQELGYESTPVRAALERAFEWYVARGLLRPGSSAPARRGVPNGGGRV